MKKVVMILFSVSFLLFTAGCIDNNGSNPLTQSDGIEQGGINQGGNTEQHNTEQGNTEQNNTEQNNTEQNTTEQNNAGQNNLGQGGETLTPEQQAVNDIIGEYTIISVRNAGGQSSYEQPNTKTPYVKINTQDYKSLLIDVNVSIDGGNYSHRKFYTLEPKKFITEKIEKQEDGSYNITLPFIFDNVIINMKQVKSYKVNHGTGMQNTPITINVNNNLPVKEDQPQNIPVIVTHDKIINPVLKIYEVVEGGVDNYIYSADIDDIYIANLFYAGKASVKNNTATYMVKAVSPLHQTPYTSFLFDVETQDKSNIFGILKVELPQR